jgi:hypothetical protein
LIFDFIHDKINIIDNKIEIKGIFIETMINNMIILIISLLIIILLLKKIIYNPRIKLDNKI